MANRRRRDINDSATRTAILDATEQIMIEDGYAGVTSRKVSTKAGFKSNLLHYYFNTMDELFIATFQRREDMHFSRFASALASSKPLHELWRLSLDAANNRLNLEFNALACHRPEVRDVIARSARRDRATMTAALRTVFERYGVDTNLYPPEVLAVTVAGISRAVSMEKTLGAEEGHDRTIAFVAELIHRYEPDVQKHAERKSNFRAKDSSQRNI